MKKIFPILFSFLCALSIFLSGCVEIVEGQPTTTIYLNNIPAYSGSPYVAINDNIPFFTDEDYTTDPFETYAALDSLGRCVEAFACIGTDLMPTEERGNISQINPSGWQSVWYDNVDGKSLYNRCHLIGFQLSGENANERNLITGTRYLNVRGMLPFENMVADFVKETGYHVLYRVTPIFDGNDLVARGVLMEGLSMEDDGDGLCFNVFAYNVQPGITIDYATGDSVLDAGTENQSTGVEVNYVLNINNHKFHYPFCPFVLQMSEKNKQEYHGIRDKLIKQGYKPCGQCNP